MSEMEELLRWRQRLAAAAAAGRASGAHHALVAVEMPEGIREGQVHRLIVRQVNGVASTIVGGFALEIAVAKAPQLLPKAWRQLSFMSHVLGTLDPDDRWWPLMERMVGWLAARVDGLGGRSADVAPNPDGSGRPVEEPRDGAPDGRARPCRWCAGMAWLAAGMLAATAVCLWQERRRDG